MIEVRKDVGADHHNMINARLTSSADPGNVSADNDHALEITSDASRASDRHDEVVRDVAWAPSGNAVMTAGDDGTARVWPVPAA